MRNGAQIDLPSIIYSQPSPTQGGPEKLLSYAKPSAEPCILVPAPPRGRWSQQAWTKGPGPWTAPQSHRNPPSPARCALSSSPGPEFSANASCPCFPSIPTFHFLIDGEAAPGGLLLLLQGLLAGRKAPDVGHIGQGVVTPVDVIRESIVFTLHNTS